MKLEEKIPEYNTLEEYLGADYTSDWKEYGKRMFKKFKLLSESQKLRIIELKSKEGEFVDYFYRGKYRKMELIAVMIYPNERRIVNRIHPATDSLPEKIQPVEYGAVPFRFRLNYTDNKDREWEGVWTFDIDNVRF